MRGKGSHYARLMVRSRIGKGFTVTLTLAMVAILQPVPRRPFSMLPVTIFAAMNNYWRYINRMQKLLPAFLALLWNLLIGYL